MRKGSRAQMLQQVFVFILAGLMFILIIGYGYRAIQYFLERQEQVVLVDFKHDLEIGVEQVKRDFQSVRKLTLRLPSKFAGVCFFDYSRCAQVSNPQLESPNGFFRLGWARDACVTGSENVFIVPRVSERFDFPDVEVPEGYVCIPNEDGVRVRLEGTGRKARVSAWS